MSTAPTPPPDSGGGRPVMNQQLAFRIAVLGGIALALLGVLLIRLWFLQVVGSEQYQDRAEGNRIREVVTEAPRGVITDRDGEILVANVPALNLVARPRELSGARREEVLRRLGKRIGVPYKELEETVAAGDSRPFESVVVAEDIDARTALYLSERRRQFPGIGLQDGFRREYPEGRVAAHILGRVGPITAESIEAYEDRGYTGEETVGIGGIEAQYEEWLRGKPERVRVEVDAAGELVGSGVVSREPAKPGNNVELSIDVDVQRALELTLRTQIARNGFATGAAGVALDVNTGEVLALASAPDFDPAVFTEGKPRQIRRLLSDSSNPLLNRVVDGGYPAASAFKPFTATAAIEGGFLEKGEVLESPSEIEIYDQPFRNFEGASHGFISLQQALQVSSDTFFYQLGADFFETGEQTPLQDTARAYGFGRRSGIDLPSEASGLVPTPEWKKRHFANTGAPTDRIWKPGDSVNLSVGQGNLQVTPLQMAVAYAGVATGMVPTPTLARRIAGPGGDALQTLGAGRQPRPLGVAVATLDPIREGLVLAANVSPGTAASVFSGVPEQYRVAGKTGTAEQFGGEDHAWFVGYAPAEDPEVVVAVIIERGGTGATAAAPAVCDTMAAVFEFEPTACGTPPS